jgi:hypothetical protein
VEWLEEFAAWWKLLPNEQKPAYVASMVAIVSSLGVSLLALAGTVLNIWLSNRGHERRLASQFSNDDRVKKVERDYEARKEAYSAAFEAFSTVAASIGAVAEPEHAASNWVERISIESRPLSRVMLFGRAETVRAISKYLNELNSFVLDLMIDAKELVDTREQIHEQQEFRRRYHDAFGGRVSRAPLSADVYRDEVLRSLAELGKTEIPLSEAKEKELRSKLKVVEGRLIERIIERMPRLKSASSGARRCMRDELGYENLPPEYSEEFAIEEEKRNDALLQKFRELSLRAGVVPAGARIPSDPR